MRMFESAIKNQHIEAISFLSAKFPNSSMYGSPMSCAINAGNPKVLEAVCKVDPASASAEIGDEESINALGYAASKDKSGELVRVLLNAGADPNREPPFKFPSSWNVSAAIIGGLPTSVFEKFFDARYRGNDPHAVRYAVEFQRPDILNVLCERSSGILELRFPPKEELIEIANKGGDLDMVKAIENAYAMRLSGRKDWLQIL